MNSLERSHPCTMRNFPLSKLKDLIIYKFKLKTKLERKKKRRLQPLSFLFCFFCDCFFLYGVAVGCWSPFQLHAGL